MRDRQTLVERTLHAPYFLDATELGDLLPLAGVEFVTGAEGQGEHGEPHAPAVANPDNQQAFTCCFAVDYRDGEDHTIERPAEYVFWRDFVPTMRPAWPGRLLDLNYSDPITLKSASRGFDPRGAGSGLWVYRRILDPRNFLPDSYRGSSGISLINWPQNDYWLGPLVGKDVSAAQGRAARGAGQAVEPLAALLAANGMPASGWEGGMEGVAAARRPGGNGGRTCQGALYPRVSADPR